MKKPLQHKTRIFFLTLILCFSTCTAASLDFDDFVLLMGQMKAAGIYLPNESVWLKKSLELLFNKRFKAPVSERDYTRFVAEALPADPKARGKFLDDALKSLVLAIPDPYASFLSAERVRVEATFRASPIRPGFGLLLTQKGNAVQVAGVLDHSAADEAGLLPGDRVISANGVLINEIRQADELIDPLRPDPISLAVLRSGKRLLFNLSARPLSFRPFEARPLSSAGYLHLELVTPETDGALLQAVRSFVNQKKRWIILDFRNCVGGDVPSASEIAGFFLKPDALIFIEKNRNRRIPHIHRGRQAFAVPLAVLTNNATASACELITGALKDHRRAIVIGEPTAGKGTIQTTWRLIDGGAIRLTTAVYLTPSGQSLLQTGMIPDTRHTWKKGESPEALENLTNGVISNHDVR